MRTIIKRTIQLLALTLLMATASCRTYEIHQGNVMEDENIWSIATGDSKFKVESLLGSPAMKDPLHPNIVRYVEDHRNIEEEEGKEEEQEKLRVIEITYDEALRVKRVNYIGFNQGSN